MEKIQRKNQSTIDIQRKNPTIHDQLATIESDNRKSIYLFIVGINTRLLGNNVNNYGRQLKHSQYSTVKTYVLRKAKTAKLIN